MSEYQICTRCIMDTSDPDITFDENGVCNHCHRYDQRVEWKGYKGKESDKALEKLVAKIKDECKNSEYDCILGLSGGLDSSYLAYLGHKLGLRMLAVHVNCGWNSPIADENVKKICEKLNLKLHTIVIDWPAMRELQRAFVFSGLANIDIPQDRSYVTELFALAKKHKVKYMLNGSNFATEGILPLSWGYTYMDWRHIKSVYKRFGRGQSIKKYPHNRFLMLNKYMLTVRGRQVNLLNYVPYTLKDATETLQKELGWQPYGGKHFETAYTRFFQGYYLPTKFGYNKHRAHLASLVVSGEITREEALKQIEDPAYYPQSQMEEDKKAFLEKLEISPGEWAQIMAAPCHTEDDFPSNKKLYAFLKGGVRFVGKLFGKLNYVN